jgi:sortase A
MRTTGYVEYCFWIITLACAGVCLAVGFQQKGYRIAAAEVSTPYIPAEHVPSGIIGRIDIPALPLSAPIVDDVETGSLRHGVGHIMGTAMPGGLGTVGLAGHRDTFIRPLRKIAPNMEIRLTDRSGTYHYLVDSTEIVSPDKVQVLDIESRPELTLVTCFPFDYVGAAPRRFIVHAHLLSASPDKVTPTP